MNLALTHKHPDKQVHDIPEVWKDYLRTRGDKFRNILIVNYLHLVRYNAERIKQKLPDEVELDDLMSAGVFGLNDAIKAFDVRRCVKFETYCSPRIRGAIIDELRAMDWVPRLVRSRTHKYDTANHCLEVEKGRKATREEIASRLHVTVVELEKIEKDKEVVSVVSLSRKRFESDSNRELREVDVIQDKKGSAPIEQAQRKDMLNILLKGYVRAERLIIVLYYFEDMTMREIGVTLDLSESRVSQMHSSILSRMRAEHTYGIIEMLQPRSNKAA